MPKFEIVFDSKTAPPNNNLVHAPALTTLHTLGYELAKSRLRFALRFALTV